MARIPLLLPLGLVTILCGWCLTKTLGWDINIIKSFWKVERSLFPNYSLGFFFRYQVFELCKRLVDVIRCLHHDQILFNDFEISHFSALGDPNPTLHPLDPLIHICDLSKATFKDGTRYDIPWSARHQFPHTAPEVLAGEPTSQSSDIFCLGKVLSSIMNAFNAADDLYLLVAWCCKRQPKDRPLVDTVHTYVVMLQALQMQKHDEPLDPIDVVDLDFTLKNQWKQHDRDQQC